MNDVVYVMANSKLAKKKKAKRSPIEMKVPIKISRTAPPREINQALLSRGGPLGRTPKAIAIHIILFIIITM